MTFHAWGREQALCEGALPAVCGAYVEDILGAEYMIPPPWTLNDVFPATSPRAPIIFILSPGADPTAELQRFAEANGRVAGEMSLPLLLSWHLPLPLCQVAS